MLDVKSSIAIGLDSSFQDRQLSSPLMQPRGSLARKRCTSAKKYHLLVFLKPNIAIMKLRALRCTRCMRCMRCCVEEIQVVGSCENIGKEFAFSVVNIFALFQHISANKCQHPVERKSRSEWRCLVHPWGSKVFLIILIVAIVGRCS